MGDMRTVRPPATGLCFWPLVAPVKEALNARKPQPVSLIEVNVDALMVQVGPAVPYRLLLVNAESDGLLRVQLWEVKPKKVDELVNDKCLSDLLTDKLKAMAAQFNLGGGG